MKLVLIILLYVATLSASFSSNIIDTKSFLPLENVIVSDSNQSVRSDINGSFTIETKEKKLHIKAYGYRPLTISIDNNISLVEVEPITIKALYLTFWGANINSKTLAKIVKIVDAGYINAIVVDVKIEYGYTSFLTSSKEANSYGASKVRPIKNIREFLYLMKSKNIYTIARVVTFKDELQASNNPEYAIKNQKGEIWRNHDNMAWVDPFDIRSHKYTLAIAEDAARIGFDEINFDYIRFPARGGLKYSKQNNEKNRLQAIETFLGKVKNRVRKYGTFISVDTYGNICWTKNDNGIGQKIESLAKHADYLAPMLYPSGFAKGSFGKKNPSSYPYEVIFKSVYNMRNRIEPIRVRPWLQYFKDYAHTKMYYRKKEIQAQIEATIDAKSSGWMMWSPSSRYHNEYFEKDVDKNITKDINNSI